jgi:hypothetical protein
MEIIDIKHQLNLLPVVFQNKKIILLRSNLQLQLSTTNYIFNCKQKQIRNLPIA